MSSKVYFTKEFSEEALLKLLEVVGKKPTGKVACKFHSGEEGNQNFLHPEFWSPLVEKVNGTVVECNTAYEGSRNTTEKHLRLLKKHGWADYFDVDLMDAEGPDYVVEIPDGFKIKKNYLGKNIKNYDFLVVLSHFKGHPMGGYGGALKQLSIGCASSFGKAYIHGAGEIDKIWTSDHDSFLESMSDAATSVVRLFNGNAIYINVMKNMSVDCDCCAVAEDPCLKDIGMLISLDPVAIDQACIDLVEKSGDRGVAHFMERVNTRNGKHTIVSAEKHGIGTRDYELINID